MNERQSVLKRHAIGHLTGMKNLIPPAAVTKDQAADMLQNDISQTLSAVLLWVQTAMAEEEQLALNTYLQLAEGHLKDSVKKLVRLHYALLSNTEDQLLNGMPVEGFSNSEVFAALEQS
jgi:hypothetical protein